MSHLVGDFLLQTDWQASRKWGGLRSGAEEARRALISHVITYTLAFSPAFIWLATGMGAVAAVAVPLVAVPHLLQDDGSLVARYVRAVKGPGVMENRPVLVWVDQSFHAVSLLVAAIVLAQL